MLVYIAEIKLLLHSIATFCGTTVLGNSFNQLTIEEVICSLFDNCNRDGINAYSK